jgi:hypothetical protein
VASGWLLGYAVDANGVLVDSETVTVPLKREAEWEDWLYEHGGRYAALVVTTSSTRVYLDPCGSLSLVYCSVLECVGSTPSMIPNEGETGEFTEFVRMVPIPYDAMFPLAVTPRKNVARLLPNHFLDLDTWQAVRHWPRTDAFPARGPAEVAEQIVERVQLNLGGVVAKRPALLRLTAGFDSRMLLACARPWVERMTVFTAQHEPSDERSWLDCSTASRLARAFDLRYVRIARRPARRADLEDWLFRTGRSVGEHTGWLAASTFKGLPPGHVDLVALAGEIARGFYWTPEDAAAKPLDADRLLSYVAAREHPQSRQVVQAWLDAAPFRDSLLVLDLFYIEQRLGCWGGVFPYAYAHDGRFQFFPLSHRAIIEAMLSLPTPPRGTHELAREVIRREWPELLSYPFNRAHGLQRVGTHWFKMRRVSTRAIRAARHPVRSSRRVVGMVRKATA